MEDSVMHHGPIRLLPVQNVRLYRPRDMLFDISEPKERHIMVMKADSLEADKQFNVLVLQG